MRRKKNRIGSFWGDVGRAVGLENAEVSTGRQRLSDLAAHLRGSLGGFAIEAGVHHAQGGEGGGDADFTYAAVTVDGLPPGLEVARWSKRQPRRLLGPKRSWVDCEVGGGKEVRAAGARRLTVEAGGLVTEAELERFDLESFLTPRRRQVICALESELVLRDTHHQLRATMPGLPYPRKRDVARSEQGDNEATQRLWASRDKVVELIRATLREAETVAQELTGDRS